MKFPVTARARWGASGRTACPHLGTRSKLTQQAREARREEPRGLLHQIKQLTLDRAMFTPIMDYRTLRGVDPRIAEHALDTLHLVPSPAHEEIKLKAP